METIRKFFRRLRFWKPKPKNRPETRNDSLVDESKSSEEPLSSSSCSAGYDTSNQSGSGGKSRLFQRRRRRLRKTRSAPLYFGSRHRVAHNESSTSSGYQVNSSVDLFDGWSTTASEDGESVVDVDVEDSDDPLTKLGCGISFDNLSDEVVASRREAILVSLSEFPDYYILGLCESIGIRAGTGSMLGPHFKIPKPGKA